MKAQKSLVKRRRMDSTTCALQREHSLTVINSGGQAETSSKEKEDESYRKKEYTLRCKDAQTSGSGMSWLELKISREVAALPSFLLLYSEIMEKILCETFRNSPLHPQEHRRTQRDPRGHELAVSIFMSY